MVPARAWQSLDRPVRWSLAAFALYGVVGVVAVVSSADRLGALNELKQGTAGISRASFSDNWFGAVGIAQFLALLVAGVAFIVFFHRAYRNLRAFGRAPDHGTGWAIGAWIVPIMSLFRPKHIANEIWEKSNPPTEAMTAPPLLSWWWAAFIVQLFASQAAFQATRGVDSRDLGSVRIATAVTLLSDVLDLVALTLVIAVVVVLYRRQEALAHAMLLRPALDPVDHRAIGVPALALIAGLVVAAPLAVLAQRSDDHELSIGAQNAAVERENAAIRAREADMAETVQQIEVACETFNTAMTALADPKSLNEVGPFLQQSVTLMDQRDASLVAAAPDGADARAAFESEFLAPVRADSDATRAAVLPVIEAARRGNGRRVTQLLGAIPDTQGVVPAAVTYAGGKGAAHCAATFSPAPEPAPA
jgi:hypothetical protein